jgi:hypothetical protein
LQYIAHQGVFVISSEAAVSYNPYLNLVQQIMVQWTNVWWRGGPKKVSANMRKRFCWSMFNVIVVAREVFIIIMCLLGVALLFLSLWLESSTKEQQRLVLLILLLQ